jgi:hypothetical protein
VKDDSGGISKMGATGSWGSVLILGYGRNWFIHSQEEDGVKGGFGMTTERSKSEG